MATTKKKTTTTTKKTTTKAVVNTTAEETPVTTDNTVAEETVTNEVTEVDAEDTYKATEIGEKILFPSIAELTTKMEIVEEEKAKLDPDVEPEPESILSHDFSPEALEAESIAYYNDREERRKAMAEEIRARMKSQIEKLNQVHESYELEDIKDEPLNVKSYSKTEKEEANDYQRILAMAKRAILSDYNY